MSVTDYIGVDPYSYDGTLGDGTLTYVDELGDIQVIPDTRTPPWGEDSPETGPADAGSQWGDPTWGPSTPVNPGPIDSGQQYDEDHEAIHGTAQPRGYDIEAWQNPSNPGIPNLGPINQQPAVSARFSVVHHYQSDEQGWGMDPAIINPRFPHSENVFPGYGQGTRKRNGTLEVSSIDYPYGTNTAEVWELQYQELRNASRLHARLVDNPQPVPFSSTVPDSIAAGAVISQELGYDEAVYE